jgi:Lon protease-like protein
MPTTEAHTRIAIWNSSRLAAWANTSCPIPFCRQHSHGDTTKEAASADSSTPASHSAPERTEGVALYPPSRPIGQSSAEGTNEQDAIPFNSKGAPVDFTISKVLAIILRELEQERLLSLPPSLRPASPALETDADNEDTEETSDAETSEEAADASFDGALFASHNVDHSFLPPGHAASRPRPPRQHIRTQNEKRRRSTAVDAEKSPSAISPPHKRSQLPSGLSPPPHRNSYSFEKELASTLECDVCTSLFFEPITTPCGHTFCSRCLARSLDHSSRCPVCRQDLPNFSFYQDHSVNKVLTSVVLTALPDDLEERRRGIEEEERDARLDTPIFVCTLAFPGMPTILHVFEPRYRLMLRRCVESGHPRFGMVLPARGTGNPNMAGIMEYGTMLEIKSIQMLPDGRSMVEAVGSYRFRLLEKGSLDGYTVGRIERLDDISPEDEAMLERLSLERARNARSEVRQALRAAQIDGSSSPDESQPVAPPSTTPSNGPQGSANVRPAITRALSTDHQPHGAASIGLPDLQPGEVEPSTEELMRTCKAFIDQLRSGSAPWLLQRLNNTYGPMPEDPSLFSFWMALVSPSRC